jgi:hypothetical protein
VSALTTSADYNIPVGGGSVDLNVNCEYTSKHLQSGGVGNFANGDETPNGQITWKLPGDRFYIGVYGKHMTNNIGIGEQTSTFRTNEQ